MNRYVRCFVLPEYIEDISEEASLAWLRNHIGVYEIYCKENDKRYVGSTEARNGFYHRFYLHINGFEKGDHFRSHLLEDWNLFGREAFEFRVLEVVTAGKAKEREQFWIDQLKPHLPENGYNRSPSAFDTSGVTHTPETCEKYRKASKGRKLSEETRARLSAVRRGKSQNRDWVEKRVASKTSKTNYRFVHKETGEIVSISNMRRFCNERDLCAAHLSSVHIGKRAHHKGWYKHTA